MKIKYTPETQTLEGLPGKTHTVEIIAIDIRKAPFIHLPVLANVQIRYENGDSEWVEGIKFFNDSKDSEVLGRYNYWCSCQKGDE